jgi:hypothetical protein
MDWAAKRVKVLKQWLGEALKGKVRFKPMKFSENVKYWWSDSAKCLFKLVARQNTKTGKTIGATETTKWFKGTVSLEKEDDLILEVDWSPDIFIEVVFEADGTLYPPPGGGHFVGSAMDILTGENLKQFKAGNASYSFEYTRERVGFGPLPDRP